MVGSKQAISRKGETLIYPHYTCELAILAAAAAKSLQSCPTLCWPHRRQPIRLPRPWDSPGKNTGVGCHFLLQCMKVKSEREVAQSCPTLNDPMDSSLPGSSIHGTFQARVLEWGAIAFSVAILRGLKNLPPEIPSAQNTITTTLKSYNYQYKTSPDFT